MKRKNRLFSSPCIRPLLIDRCYQCRHGPDEASVGCGWTCRAAGKRRARPGHRARQSGRQSADPRLSTAAIRNLTCPSKMPDHHHAGPAGRSGCLDSKRAFDPRGGQTVVNPIEVSARLTGPSSPSSRPLSNPDSIPLTF
jgi:hypothetical protein